MKNGSMNCGECLIGNVEIVPLVNGVCDKCGAYKEFKIIGDKMRLSLVALAERQTGRGMFLDEEQGKQALNALKIGECLNTGVSAWERVK